MAKTKKNKKKRKFLLVGLVGLAVGILVIWFNWSAGKTEEKIQNLIPSGAFLREIELIPGVSPKSYLVIYIKDPKLDEVSKKDPPYTSCPEATEGQAIEGVYHLALFQKNSLVSDVVVPSGFWYIDPETISPTTGPGGRGKLSYMNTKRNIHNHFNGPEPSQEEEFEIEKVKLIQLQDFTGDGQAHEFRIEGAAMACGHWENLIAGYDEEENKVLVYPIITEGSVSYWYDNFEPDSSGRLDYYFRCGDHGATTELYKLFQFDSGKKAYFLLEERETPCEIK